MKLIKKYNTKHELQDFILTVFFVNPGSYNVPGLALAHR